jgi:hypothetical protein
VLWIVHNYPFMQVSTGFVVHSSSTAPRASVLVGETTCGRSADFPQVGGSCSIVVHGVVPWRIVQAFDSQVVRGKDHQCPLLMILTSSVTWS